MGEDDAKELEIKAPGGFEGRAKGYRLIDLIWIPLVMMVGYIGMTQNTNEVNAQSYRTAAAVADKEASKAFVEAIKESNSNTLAAIRELTVEQRKSTNAIREVACLSDPAMRNRVDAREFCKRIGRAE